MKMENGMSKKILAVFAALLLASMACQGSIKETQTPVVPTDQVSINPQTTFTPPSQTPSQIILVMDVSGSMAGYVIPSPPPDELRELLDKIYAIENDPAIKDLEDELDAILEQPAIKEASAKTSEADYERMTHIQNSFGVDLFDLTLHIEEILIKHNCEEYAARYAIDESSVDEALEYLGGRCGEITQDERNEIADRLDFLDDSTVQELTSRRDDLEQRYYDLLDDTQYYEISDQLDALYDESGYYELSGELDEKAEALGLPTRLDFAKAAASSILDLMELDQKVSGQNQKVGLVVFTTYAKMLLPFTSDIQEARETIESLRDQNMTNLGGGLEIALEMAKGSEEQTTIILLSDGWTNVGAPRETILDSTSRQIAEQGIRICSAGFGTKEDDIDKELLGQLADETGGKYLFTSSGGELVSFFIACRQQTVAEDVASLQGPINAGQTVHAGQFNVEPYTAELTLALNYINADLNLLITDPAGEQVTAGYPNLTQSFSPGLQLWKIENPEAGEWRIEVQSGNAGEDVGVYHVVISTTPGEPPLVETPANNLVILTALIGIVCVLIAAIFFAGGGFLLYYARKKKMPGKG
ncbi:VWA domain-containing protein [Chloroflexi bacterium CFX5]|nr:VWA domain-containing protein [Chloroflexi bacterium CFX5]